LIVAYFKELAARANLGSWDSWSTQYRLLAVVLGLLVAYWALRVMVPAVLRILRPFLFLAIVLAAVWALYPTETCSIEFLSKLPILCAR
jgi:hypothetical protein